MVLFHSIVPLGWLYGELHRPGCGYSTSCLEDPLVEAHL